MADKIDALFGADAAAAVPRFRLIYGLLATGITLAVLGLVCSSVPGAIVSLISWAMVEKEVERLESGYYATEYESRLRLARGLVQSGLLGILCVIAIQIILLCSGFYHGFWAGLIEALRGGM